MFFTTKDPNPLTFWHGGEANSRTIRKLSRRIEPYDDAEIKHIKVCGFMAIIVALVGAVSTIVFFDRLWPLLVFVVAAIMGGCALYSIVLPVKARATIKRLEDEGKIYASNSVGYRLFIRSGHEITMVVYKRAIEGFMALYREHMVTKADDNDEYWFLDRSWSDSWRSIQEAYLNFFLKQGVDYSAEVNNEVWLLSNELAADLNRQVQGYLDEIERIEMKKSGYVDVRKSV